MIPQNHPDSRLSQFLATIGFGRILHAAGIHKAAVGIAPPYRRTVSPRSDLHPTEFLAVVGNPPIRRGAIRQRRDLPFPQ